MTDISCNSESREILFKNSIDDYSSSNCNAGCIQHSTGAEGYPAAASWMVTVILPSTWGLMCPHPDLLQEHYKWTPYLLHGMKGQKETYLAHAASLTSCK